jgi:hypothetical protein
MSDGGADCVKVTRRHVVASAGRILIAVLGAAASMASLPDGTLAQSGGRKSQPRGRAPAPTVVVGTGTDGLPPAVVEMRAEILSAVETGDIAELKRAMDLNELKPEFGGAVGSDPIEHLRQVSADGKGVSVLLHLGRLLAGKWAGIPGGRDIENNRIYVWPHFAEVALDKLDADDRAELAKLVGEPAATAMLAGGKWRGWRLSIGADGVWHTYMEVGS